MTPGYTVGIHKSCFFLAYYAMLCSNAQHLPTPIIITKIKSCFLLCINVLRNASTVYMPLP